MAEVKRVLKPGGEFVLTSSIKICLSRGLGGSGNLFGR